MQVGLRLKRTFSVLCLIFLLSACVEQITSVATITPLPDITAQPTVTPSPLPPITGKLFFDMNGSGLQDESTFIYEPDRMNDPRQLLQPDLSIAIADFLASHPEIKK